MLVDGLVQDVDLNNNQFELASKTSQHSTWQQTLTWHGAALMQGCLLDKIFFRNGHASGSVELANRGRALPLYYIYIKD